MKKLISYLFAGILACSSTNLNGIEIPYRLVDYQFKAKNIAASFVHGKPPIFSVYYDVDGDLIPDVEEARVVKSLGENPEIETYPISYWFDFNGDKEQGIEEIIIDPYRDGLNGNETFFLDRVNKTNL